MSSAAPAPILDDEHLYRISEVSQITSVKAFVLRYWEEEFPMLQPVKSPSGHRLYRQQDVDLVIKIKGLLYDEGFTIAGARRHLNELANGNGDARSAAGGNTVRAAPAATIEPVAAVNRQILLDLRDSLRSFLTLLERK